jgi:hypothetical protein
MNRAMITLVLGFVVMAVSAGFGAVAASASEPVYFASTTAEYPVSMSATVAKMTVLEAGTDTVTCAKVVDKAKLTGPSTVMTVAPSYGECTAVILGVKTSATITPGSCGFEFGKLAEGAESEGEIKELTGQEAVVSGGCGSIEIKTAVGCVFNIPAQSAAKGTTVLPSKEGMEVTSEITGAKVTSKGCGEEKTLNPIHFWIIVSGVWRIYTEFVNLHFSFWNGGVEVGAGGLKFMENQEATIEIRNRTRWPILNHNETVEGNNNWLYTNIVGEPGTVCYKVFYFPMSSCRFKLKAPAEMPARQRLKTWGIIFPRGELPLET